MNRGFKNLVLHDAWQGPLPPHHRAHRRSHLLGWHFVKLYIHDEFQPGLKVVIACLNRFLDDDCCYLTCCDGLDRRPPQKKHNTF